MHWNLLITYILPLKKMYCISSWVSSEELQCTSRAEVSAQPFHEELWSEGPGARPLHGACYEQVKQTKHKGKKGGWARPEVRLPDLCPFQMKSGSSSNRKSEERGPSRWQRSKTWRSPSSPKIHLHVEQLLQNTCWTLAEDPRLPKSRVADRVLVLWLAVRPEPLRWESWVQDIGPTETSRPHVISISESYPRDFHLNAKSQLHSMTSKLQCWTPHAKQLARQEHNPTH